MGGFVFHRLSRRGHRTDHRPADAPGANSSVHSAGRTSTHPRDRRRVETLAAGKDGQRDPESNGQDGHRSQLVVQRQSDMDMRAIRELAALPDLGGAELRRIHAAVGLRYDVRPVDVWLCRYVDGTSTVSKHGYQASTWKGTAEDIFVNSGGMSELVKVGQFIVDQTEEGHPEGGDGDRGQRHWQPSTGWQDLRGSTALHVHTDIGGQFGVRCR